MSGLLGANGEVPGGTNSPTEFAGVSKGDLGESDEVVLGLLKHKKASLMEP